MEKDLKEVNEYYQQNYFHEEISNRIKEKVHQKIHPKRVSLGKKLLYFSSAAIAALGLFIGLAFMSPAVANVAAKVPFLNMIFQSKPIEDVIQETLSEKGYKFEGFGTRYEPKKVFWVALQGSEEYVEKVRPEVEEIVKGLLLERDFDAFEVKVERSRDHRVVLSEEEQKNMEKEMEVSNVVFEVLKSYGHETPIGYNFVKKTIEISLPNTETKKEEIKEKIQSELEARNFGTYTITVQVYNAKKREREMRWSPVFDTIADGVYGNKKYNVIGVGYSNKSSEYMIITIHTSVSSKDSDYEEVMTDLEDTIHDFLTSKEIKEIIKDDAYKVFIISKDKKERVVTNKSVDD